MNTKGQINIKGQKVVIYIIPSMCLLDISKVFLNLQQQDFFHLFIYRVSKY